MLTDIHTAPRLNPFAFPSETKGRFAMLIVAALILGGYVGWILLVTFTGRSELGGVSARSVHVTQRWSTIDPFSMGPKDLPAIDEQALEIHKSLRVEIRRLLLASTPLLFLGVCAIAIYRRHPKRLRRRWRSNDQMLLTRSLAPRAVGDLEDCANQSGIVCPRIECWPGIIQGHAFGIRGGEVIILSSTPELIERSWGLVGRAIAFHELAHVKNQDAHDRERAIAIWKALVLLFLAAVILLVLQLRFFSGEVLIKIALMAMVVRGIGAGLIRVREFYADWRAHLWGAGPELSRLLTMPEVEHWPWERWSWWWKAWAWWGGEDWWRGLEKMGELFWRRSARLLHLHPSFAARRKILLNPSKLFEISWGLSLLVGILLAFLLSGCLPLVFEFMVAVLDLVGLAYASMLRHLVGYPPGLSRLFPILVAMMTLCGIPIAFSNAILLGFSYLIARTIGVQVQRQAVVNFLSKESHVLGYARLLIPASCFVLGLEIGFSLAPAIEFMPRLPDVWVLIPLWMVGCTVLMWSWLAYIHGLSSSMLGNYSGDKPPKGRQQFITIASATLLTILSWPAVIARFAMVNLFLSKVHNNPVAGKIPSETISFSVFLLGAVLLIVLLIFVIYVALTCLVSKMRRLRISNRCYSCQGESAYTTKIGRNCYHCGRSLTPWLFVGDAEGKGSWRAA